MGKKSREKGKLGEREFSQVLQSLGYNARRGIQFAGGPDSPDIVSDIPGVHFEVKRMERLELWKALNQATEDAGEAVPVVAHRPNRKPWVVILPAERMIEFAESLLVKRYGKDVDDD